MESVTLSIDGRRISCPAGTSVLEAADRLGIRIPRLCHHTDLEPFGACRLCLVEDDKSGRLSAACVTPAGRDMAFLTDTPRVRKHRRNIIRLMLAEHPESCIVCGKGNRCRLRRIAAELGVGETGLYPMPNFQPLEQANPFLVRDLSKCVLCGKCIRADHELVVVGAIDYSFRGFDSRPLTTGGLPLEHSNCTFCGTCLSMCPTGALSPQNRIFIGSPEREFQSVCGFCGIGCTLTFGVFDGRIVEAGPADRSDSVNRSTLCLRGHFAHDFLNSKHRLTDPLVRREGELTPVDWDEALEIAADRLSNITKEYGPQSVAFLGSSKCTNEENYLFQKLARTIVRTHNVDNAAFFAGRRVFNRLMKRLDQGGRANPLAGLEKAEAILSAGADPAHSAPVLSYHLKRATRRGTPLILMDPRPTELSPFADVHLPVKPGTDVIVIDALAALLLRKGAWDNEFVDRYTEEFDTYRQSLSAIDTDRACFRAGITPEALEAAAGLLAGRKTAIVTGSGILRQRHSLPAMDALLNLALLTGSLGMEGTGIYLEAHENNQFGSWDMGSASDLLPGAAPLTNDRTRQTWERAWRIDLSPDPGLNPERMIEEAEKGALKALYIMGENPLRAMPDRARVKRALEKIEFLVVQDILAGECLELANVVLPGAAFSEKSGSFTNMEGRIQSFRPVVSPPGNALPDWEIIDRLIEKMGGSAFGALEDMRNEIGQFVPAYRGLGGLTDDGGAVFLENISPKRLFHPDGSGDPIVFSPVVDIEEESPVPEYPYDALFVSSRFHVGSGTRTALSRRLNEMGETGGIEISMADAMELGLKNGDPVMVKSQEGDLTRTVKVSQGLRPGLVSIPATNEQNVADRLLEHHRFESSGFNTCRVKLEKV